MNALRAFKAECDRSEFRFEPATCTCGAGNEQALLIAAQDRYGLPINTYLCRKCGVLWGDPKMTPDALGRFYGRYYRALYGRGAAGADDFYAMQTRRGEDVIRYITPEFTGIPGATVYDIGCATGGVLMPFAERGARTMGCDYSLDYLERGRQAGLNLLHGDATSLSGFGPADLVIARHVLEHCPDPLCELRAWDSLLRTGGYLYIEVPSVLMSYEVYGDFARFLQNAHLYHFTLRTLECLLSEIGYMLVKGNQTVRALFVKPGDATPIGPDPAEADRVLQYIQQREKIARLMRWRRRAFDAAIFIGDRLIGGRKMDRVKRFLQSRRK